MASNEILKPGESVMFELDNLQAMCYMVFQLNLFHGLDSVTRTIMDEEIEEKWMEYLCRVKEMEVFFKTQRSVLRKNQPALRMWRNFHIAQITKVLSDYMVAVGLAIQLRADEELKFETVKPAHETVDSYLRKIRLKVES